MNIEKLNNSNYFTWKYQTEMILIKDDLWEVININDNEEEGDQVNRRTTQWKTKDAKARATIGLLVEKDQLVHIRNKTTAQETWNALKMAHEQDIITNRVSIYKKIAQHKMTKTIKIEEHINELICQFQKLSDLGEETSEQWKIGMLLASLPKEYSTLITALEGRSDDNLNWNTVITKIIDENQQGENLDDEISEKVLQIQEKKYCYFCKKDNHKMKDCFSFKRYQQFIEFEKYQRETTKKNEQMSLIQEIRIEEPNEELLL